MSLVLLAGLLSEGVTLLPEGTTGRTGTVLPSGAILLHSGKNKNESVSEGHHGIYIPSSQCFFCICLKCGTTSLFQYIFGATHGTSWCDFANKHLSGGRGAVDGCSESTKLMEASLQAIGVMPLDENSPYIDPDGHWNLPYVQSPDGPKPMRIAEPSAGTSLRELAPQDLSEYITKSYWGNVFKGKYGGKTGDLPEELWAKAYKHAIVRDPVQRLISAWVNKLSCGLYSVPEGRSGKDGASKEDQDSWLAVSESTTNVERYSASLEKISKVHSAGSKYMAPCNLQSEGHHNHATDVKMCGAKQKNGTFTFATCKSHSLERFADAMTKVYKLWADDEWVHSSGSHHQLNSHFNPQAGPGSCFKNYKEDVKLYDTISTITDKKKMKQFSAHLPSHKLGLWGDQHSNSRGGNLYFEGKKFVIPTSVISKLKRITEVERKVFGNYL
jgi:hypothetical protein